MVSAGVVLGDGSLVLDGVGAGDAAGTGVESWSGVGDSSEMVSPGGGRSVAVFVVSWVSSLGLRDLLCDDSVSTLFDSSCFTSVAGSSLDSLFSSGGRLVVAACLSSL